MDTNISKMPILANDSLLLFTGTENHYQHVSGYYYTDGIHHARNIFECYWLIHDVLWIARKNNFPGDRLLVWNLERSLITENEKVIKRFTHFFLTCTMDGEIIFKKAIQYSDFWPDKFVMYFRDNVLYLPSEV